MEYDSIVLAVDKADASHILNFVVITGSILLLEDWPCKIIEHRPSKLHVILVLFVRTSKETPDFVSMQDLFDSFLITALVWICRVIRIDDSLYHTCETVALLNDYHLGLWLSPIWLLWLPHVRLLWLSHHLWLCCSHSRLNMYYLRITLELRWNTLDLFDGVWHVFHTVVNQTWKTTTACLYWDITLLDWLSHHHLWLLNRLLLDRLGLRNCSVVVLWLLVKTWISILRVWWCGWWLIPRISWRWTIWV